MAKKILGDDPFRTSKDATDAKKKQTTNKSKRVVNRKIEAPLVTSAQPSAPAKKQKMRVAPPMTDGVADVVGEVVFPVATTQALTPRETDEAPTDAAPGSWRWWRYRQQQLARAEEVTWLARTDGSRDRFGRDPRLAGRAEPIVDMLYRSWLRVSVRGLGHVPETGRAILVARRRQSVEGFASAALDRLGLGFGAALDAAIVGHAIRTEHVAHREVRPLVRPARLYTPFFGPLLRRLGGVPADLHDFARLLDDDRLALAFVDDRAAPRHADLLDLSTIVSLALVTGAPIIPVVIASPTSSTLRDRLGILGGRPSITALAFGTPQFPGAEFGTEGAEDNALVARLASDLSSQL